MRGASPGASSRPRRAPVQPQAARPGPGRAGARQPGAVVRQGGAHGPAGPAVATEAVITSRSRRCRSAYAIAPSRKPSVPESSSFRPARSNMLSRRQRCGDPELAGRPLPLPARLHGPPAGDRPDRPGPVPGRRGSSWHSRRGPDRQRAGLHHPVRRRPPRPRHPERVRAGTGRPRRSAEELQPEPPADLRQGRTLPPDPEEMARRPTPARTRRELQAQLDLFRPYYNCERPHRALGRSKSATPAAAHAARPKATPTGISPTHERVRRDRIDDTGAVTIRYHGRLHHIGIGRTHARTHVLLLVQDRHIRVIVEATGELLRELTLAPPGTTNPGACHPAPNAQDPNPSVGSDLCVCRETSQASRLRESNPRPTHHEDAASPLPPLPQHRQHTHGSHSPPRPGRTPFVMPEAMPAARWGCAVLGVRRTVAHGLMIAQARGRPHRHARPGIGQ
jgi:hypothetical protein